jgi:hypothetical protein
MTLPSDIGALSPASQGERGGDENPARLLIELGYQNSHGVSRAKNQDSGVRIQDSGRRTEVFPLNPDSWTVH